MCCIFIQMSLKLVPMGQINKPVSFQIMNQEDDKPLFTLILAYFHDIYMRTSASIS